MSYKGYGYCVGLGNTDEEGPMVFDIKDKGSQFVFIIREDKPYSSEDENRRRENAIYLSLDHYIGLPSYMHT